MDEYNEKDYNEIENKIYCLEADTTGALII